MSEQKARTSNPTIDPISYNAGIEAAREHDLKTWPEFFEEVVAGHKTFEVRNNDRDYRVGDVLLLREWSPQTCEYSGREIRKLVTYVMRERLGLDPDMVIMGLRSLRPNCADETDCSNVRQCRAVEEAYAAPADAERLALAGMADEFCQSAFGPFGVDVSSYSAIVFDLLQKALALRAGGWRGATCKELLQVPDSSAPHTDKGRG